MGFVKRTIDLNSDLGESFGAWRMGDDEAMLELVSSANIACGFHAGDASVMLSSCTTAARNGVAVGAHVSYRDLAGFGRRAMDVPSSELYADVLYQLAALDGIARVAGTRVAYVKPHGALYNRIVSDEEQADAVARAVADFDLALPLLGLAGSSIARRARDRGLSFVHEAFVDRGYLADGSLVPRGWPGDLLTDVDAIAARAVGLVIDGRVATADGTVIDVAVDSLCVHGDTPGAVGMARAVRSALTAAGIRIEAFAP
ncbi:LamB/YcsF family protein [Diaminobutyricibacter tongyongensis]|uniref:LamB/YcsF family protein n=1 Tax=Leifsonia tongyongensis TaxID=1268043 RepID=UPI001877E48E|nr:5-oxoprolinase subunit PxpA [Diaminobutyricibacter tongyongensis]